MKRLKHYRPARYRAHRKPINKTLLIGVVAAAVILVVSIALGLYLGKISAPDTDTDRDTGKTTTPEQQYGAYEKINVSPVSALPFPAAAYESDSEAERAILRANGEMAGALCINLLTEQGAPSYKSEAYSRVYSAEAVGFDLKLFAEKAKKNAISAIGVFPMHSFREENSDIKNNRQEFELSLLCEAHAYGVGEVTLTGIDGGSPAELYSFMKKLKEQCPTLAVGILISAERAADTLLCAELDDIFDFLVFEHTSAFKETVADYLPDKNERSKDETESETEEETEPPKSALYESIESLLVTAERFGARVYIDIGDGCEYCLKTAKGTLSKLGVENFMLTLSDTQH